MLTLTMVAVLTGFILPVKSYKCDYSACELCWKELANAEPKTLTYSVSLKICYQCLTTFDLSFNDAMEEAYYAWIRATVASDFIKDEGEKHRRMAREKEELEKAEKIKSLQTQLEELKKP